VTGLLAGHHAVVVGAGGALGRAICRACARAGARVTALDRDEGAAAAAVAGAPGGPHAAHALDVTDLDAVRAAAARAGAVDSVVYAAGLTATFDVLDTDWDAYHRLLDVNLHGALRVAQAFGAAMVAARRPGSFAFLSSTAGLRGEAGASAYCASKFGLRGLVESFAAEMAPHGIRVNAICPGDVDSPMLREVAAGQAARAGVAAGEVLAAYAAASPAGRLVRPEEVAGVAVWLASPLAAGVAGESVTVDLGAPAA
jgi:NAD(P)-dependent dehydrogenase (short-subunit alcohol dehydrogenase family)